MPGIERGVETFLGEAIESIECLMKVGDIKLYISHEMKFCCNLKVYYVMMVDNGCVLGSFTAGDP